MVRTLSAILHNVHMIVSVPVSAYKSRGLVRSRCIAIQLANGTPIWARSKREKQKHSNQPAETHDLRIRAVSFARKDKELETELVTKYAGSKSVWGAERRDLMFPCSLASFPRGV